MAIKKNNGKTSGKTTNKAALKSELSESSLSGIQRPLTLVAQVEQSLRTAIEDGVFANGRLPVLVDLADQLRVSRETVRLALDSLQSEGLIQKHRRRGTFVSSAMPPTVLTGPKHKVLGYLLEEYDFEGEDAEVVARPHIMAMLEGAIIEAGRNNYQLTTRSAKPYNLREAFDQLNSLGPISGMIFACVGEEKFLKGVSGRKLPAVLLDHELHLPKVGSVRGDSEQNARISVAHLAELGHRRIACAHWQQSDLNPWFLRGYRIGMKESGLRRSSAWELFVELNQKGADEAVESILKLKSRPTAVICFHNTLARQFIKAANEAGLRVPQDISVVGGGGEKISDLTSCKLDWHLLGKHAVQILLKAIEEGDESSPEHLRLPYELHVAGTTGPVA